MAKYDVETMDASDDAEWKDEDSQDQELEAISPASLKGPGTYSTRSSSPTVNGSSPRRRRKVVHTTSSSRRSRSASNSDRLKPRPRLKAFLSEETQEDIQAGLKLGARSTAIYTLEVVTTSLSWLKAILSLFLLIWITATILNYLSSSLRTIFSPLCSIPVISRSSMCTPLHVPLPKIKHADYPKMVEMQSKTFNQLLDDSVGGSGLALDIKKAEVATRDLITLVVHSDLTSKDNLARSLAEFVDDARRTGLGLQRLSSKIGGAVDNVFAVNDYALHSIEAASTGSPSQVSILSYLWPFGSHSNSPSQEVITAMFEQSMSVLSASFERLIIEAEISRHNLDKLEQQLQTVQAIVAREDSSLASEKSDLLAALWTKLGRNRRAIQGVDSHLTLLRNIGAYRTRALAHVVASLQALQAISMDMEDLRDRVAAPELVGGEIPLEVHMQSIRMGLERLNQGRLYAKKRGEDIVNRIMGSDA